jgi:ArsR family transcriptional regulator
MLLIKDQGELCVCELMQALQQIQPKVSRNLAQLKNCGLLLSEKHGQWVYYRLNNDLDAWANKLLDTTLEGCPDFLAENLRNLSNMGDRPERVSQCC